MRRRVGGIIPYVGGRVAMPRPYVGGRCGRGRRGGSWWSTAASAALKVGKKALPFVKKAFKKGKQFAKDNPELIKKAKDFGKKKVDDYLNKQLGVTQKPNNPNVVTNKDMNVLPTALEMKSNPAEPMPVKNTNPFLDSMATRPRAKKSTNPFASGLSGGRKRRRGRPCTYSKRGRGVKAYTKKFGGIMLKGPIA